LLWPTQSASGSDSRSSSRLLKNSESIHIGVNEMESGVEQTWIKPHGFDAENSFSAAC